MANSDNIDYKKLGNYLKAKGYLEPNEEKIDEDLSNNIKKITGNPSIVIEPPVVNKKVGKPRQLCGEEMFEDLELWIKQVEKYYGSDEVMYPFVNEEMIWDLSMVNCNLREEHGKSKLKRSAKAMAKDLKKFLEIMGGFIEDGFHREVIRNKTRCFGDVVSMFLAYYMEGNRILDISVWDKNGDISESWLEEFYGDMNLARTKVMRVVNVVGKDCNKENILISVRINIIHSRTSG